VRIPALMGWRSQECSVGCPTLPPRWRRSPTHLTDQNSGCQLVTALVLELVGGAFAGRDVAALADIDGLVDGTAFSESIEVLHLTDFTYCRNRVVGRNGDVSCRHQLIVIAMAVAFIESERDTAFGIAGGDDEGRGFDELGLQLRSTRVWTTRAVGSIYMLEDHAFAVALAIRFELPALRDRIHIGFYRAQR